MTRSKSLPLFPFLAAIYPVLALAAENKEEFVDPLEVVRAAVLSIAVAAVAWIVAGFATRDRSRRSLLALYGVLFVAWYGVFLAALRACDVPAPLTDYRVSLLLWSLPAIAGTIATLRARETPETLAQWLNLTTAILIVFPVATLLRQAWEPSAGEERIAHASAATGGEEVSGPDIFLLVLDKYTGRPPLEANYGYDNGPFEDSLRARGFFVPRASRANYVLTAQALASMLNWTHLDEVARENGHDSRDRTALYSMIEDNRARRFLAGRGYEFVFFPTPYRGTTQNRYADFQFPEPFEPSIDFELSWLMQTPLAPILTRACKRLGCDGGGSGSFPYPPESAEEIEGKFQKLAELADRPGPQFIFAHFLVPHEPFVFGADCSHRLPVWEPDVGSPDSVAAKGAYVEQIRCLNQMLLRLVDGILVRSRRPPVIVLQGDHGHGRMVIDPIHNRTVPREDLSPAQVEERTSVFAAYHFPQGGKRLLYDSITQVNVFPLILDHYFGQRIPLREDATFWVEPGRPYRFTRIP